MFNYLLVNHMKKPNYFLTPISLIILVSSMFFTITSCATETATNETITVASLLLLRKQQLKKQQRQLKLLQKRSKLLLLLRLQKQQKQQLKSPSEQPQNLLQKSLIYRIINPIITHLICLIKSTITEHKMVLTG